MLIILLTWFPLSLPLAVLVGKCLKLGMGEPDNAGRRARDRAMQLVPAR